MEPTLSLEEGRCSLESPKRALQDRLGTGFSAASVIPAGDIHFASTAWGHVSKIQMLYPAP